MKDSKKYFEKNGFIWGIGNIHYHDGQYLIRFDDYRMFQCWAKDNNNVWCSQTVAEKWQKKYIG